MAIHDELLRLRDAMDVCNRRLAAVLHERAALARRIGAWKRAHGVAITDTEREAAMQTRMKELARTDGFDAAALERIFATVFAESRALAERAR